MAEIVNETPRKTESQDLESVRSDEFIKLYANSARMETTIFDLKIFFGELVQGGEKSYVQEYACISMSPQHAKAMHGVLGNHLSEYETRFGPIPIPRAEAKGEAPKKP